MPQNKRESLIFTVIMCAFMVFIMSVYNIVLYQGFSVNAIQKAWMGFPLAYIVGILCDWFIVSKLAKTIAFKIAKPGDKKLIFIIPTGMVCGMVILMSLYGAIEHVGISKMTLMVWVLNIPKNFVMALPLQLIIVGPTVRYLFRKTFPIGTIVVNS